MDAAIEVAVEPDPDRPKLFCVTIRDNAGALLDTPAKGMEAHLANRAAIYVRAAFLTGARWMRDFATSHLLATTPYVVCSIAVRGQNDQPDHSV